MCPERDKNAVKVPATPANKANKPSEFSKAQAIANLPDSPGVYQFINQDRAILYIGKAKNLRKRVGSYFPHSRQSERIKLMLKHATSLEHQVVANEYDALILEQRLIRSLKPRFNILFRDDKTYPYIKISTHKFPRISFYRGQVGKHDNCLGPFPDVSAAKTSIDLLQKAFGLRVCTDNVFAHRSKPCMYYQIKRCSAPCVGYISKEQYQSDVQMALSSLHDYGSNLSKIFNEKMQHAAQQQDYEQAVLWRDRISALQITGLENLIENMKYPDADIIALAQNESGFCINVIHFRGHRRISESRHLPKNTNGVNAQEVLIAYLQRYYHALTPPALIFSPNLITKQKVSDALGLPTAQSIKIITNPRGRLREHTNLSTNNAKLALAQTERKQERIQSTLAQLQKMLHLEQAPARIDCIDISHTQSESIRAGKVSFVNAKPDHSNYRRWAVQFANKAKCDDTQAMHNSIIKFYRNDPLPDILLVDGGVGQINAAIGALAKLEKSCAILGIVKGEGRRSGLERICEQSGVILPIIPTTPLFTLLIMLRDEAHRFAHSSHTRVRDRARAVMRLEDLPGIGRKKSKLILETIGGINQLSSISASKLQQIPGIGKYTAEQIIRHISARK